MLNLMMKKIIQTFIKKYLIENRELKTFLSNQWKSLRIFIYTKLFFIGFYY